MIKYAFLIETDKSKLIYGKPERIEQEYFGHIQTIIKQNQEMGKNAPPR